MATKNVKGAGRAKFAAQQAKHSQRGALPARNGRRYTAEEHTADLKKAAGVKESIAAPIAPASSKAGAFADKAEEHGWTVKRSRHEDGGKSVTATRDAEHLYIAWNANEVFEPITALWSLAARSRKIKNAADGYRLLARSHEDALTEVARASAPKAAPKAAAPKQPRKRVPFDAKTATPEEVVAAVAGRRVTWYNSFTEDFEEGHVPPENRTKTVNGPNGTRVEKHIASQTSVKLSEADGSFGRMILAFCDPLGGYRACFVDAIQSVR